MKYYQFIFIFISLIFQSQAQAQVYTGIAFSEEEKALHLSKINILTNEASKCLNETYNDHVNFFKKNKVSKYYGNRRYVKGWEQKISNGRTLTPIKLTLQKNGFDPNLEDAMTSMSCVDFSRMCLERGFKKAGLSDQWKKVDAYIPDKIGNMLQHALQALGWKILYWNPDVSQNIAWDLDDQKIAPGNPLNVWGYNEARYQTVVRKGQYLFNVVDDSRSLVNFGTNPPRFIDELSFGLGTANGGYHVFLITKGNVIEAHSSRSLFALDNLEFSPFNPLASGGGPRWTRSEKYRSGILVVPPNAL